MRYERWLAVIAAGVTPRCAPRRRRGRGEVIAALAIWVAGAWTAAATGGTELFQITSFANPPSSLTYFEGFSGVVGSTGTWPSEMGWQGDRIDIGFFLPAEVPAIARNYRFRMVITHRFVQTFDVAVLAGPSLTELVEVRREFADTPRVLTVTIPLEQFTPGQVNWIRLQGIGVSVGNGQPAGIRWNRWALSRTDSTLDLQELRTDQLQRGAAYVLAAIQPSGLVRDSLTYSPSVPPFHPATPDAAGFALVGLCVADELRLVSDAAARARAILSAYAGGTPGVTPARNARGHWWHWMNVNTGLPEPGWNDNYTTIGSALLVSGAMMAKSHFVEDAAIAALAEELRLTCDFDAMIHPSLDGRVSLATDVNGNAMGTLVPWNEYMLIVSLALRQPGATRAPVMAWRWLDPANVPKAYYPPGTQHIATLTDSPGSFAPAFWVQDGHYLCTDFATNPAFEAYFRNHQRADALYCAAIRLQPYRYGLTAGVSPGGYTADRIGHDVGVYSPEAVAAWGDLDSLLEFAQDQPPASDARFRYGLTRVSTNQPTWVPSDAALVDHAFLMLGLMESIDPLFFKRRLPFQVDADGDGIADAYDNCLGAWNPRQQDSDGDGTGDACQCATPAFDLDRDADVDLHDFARLQRCPRSDGVSGDGCLCVDIDGDHRVGPADVESFLACWESSGPLIPATCE